MYLLRWTDQAGNPQEKSFLRETLVREYAVYLNSLGVAKNIAAYTRIPLTGILKNSGTRLPESGGIIDWDEVEALALGKIKPKKTLHYGMGMLKKDIKVKVKAKTSHAQKHA